MVKVWFKINNQAKRDMYVHLTQTSKAYRHPFQELRFIHVFPLSAELWYGVFSRLMNSRWALRRKNQKLRNLFITIWWSSWSKPRQPWNPVLIIISLYFRFRYHVIHQHQQVWKPTKNSFFVCVMMYMGFIFFSFSIIIIITKNKKPRAWRINSMKWAKTMVCPPTLSFFIEGCEIYFDIPKSFVGSRAVQYKKKKKLCHLPQRWIEGVLKLSLGERGKKNIFWF